MTSADEAPSPQKRYSGHGARGADDSLKSAEAGQVVQAGSAGGSHEHGEHEREDGDKINRGRGTRINNGERRSRKSRSKHKRSSYADEGTAERREDRVGSSRLKTHLEAPNDGNVGLEEELGPVPLPGAVHTSISEKGGGDNGLDRTVGAKRAGKSSCAPRHLHNISDAHIVHSKAEKSNKKTSPLTSALKMTASAARTAYHPIEEGAKRSPSTVAGGAEQGAERTQQAKRLALEVAKLRSALRVSNSDLVAERKARARLEDDRWEKAKAWGHERGVIVFTRHEAERALQAAQEELDTLRKQEDTRRTKAKVEAAAHEVSHRKTESALNRVIKVQDRLVRALQTEVDLTNRARDAAQVDTREIREQLRQCERDFLSWRDRAKLLEDRMEELGQPLPRPHGRDPPSQSCARLTFSMPSTQSHRSRQGQSNHGKEPRSAGRSIAWKNREFPAGNRQIERDGEDAENSAGKGSLGDREDSFRRNEAEGDHTNEACLEDARRFVNKRTGYTRHDHFDDDPLPLVSRGSEKPTAPPEAFLANTNEAMASIELSDSKENFQRSMKAQQEISTRIERELARARADLTKIYARGNSGKKGATDPAITFASPEDRKDPGLCADSDREEPEKGDDCDVGTDHADAVGVPGPHSARVLAALLGVETSSRGKVSEAKLDRRTVGGKPGRTAAPGAGVVQSSSKPHLRLSDYPPQVQAIFRTEPPPLTGAPTPISGKKASPGRYQPPEGTQPLAAAAREKGGSTSPVARGKAKEGYAIADAFREYEPKSPLLRRWLAEKSSAASPIDEEE